MNMINYVVLMRKMLMSFALVITLYGLSFQALAQDNPGGVGGIQSLRGGTELEQTRPADPMKKVAKQVALADNNFVGQPPLIPHHTRHYEVSLNANKCLACHSWKQANEAGAVKISVTHYQNREGQILSDVSPRRYFCLQCHVTQVEAKPLVVNEFIQVESLRQQ